jgi:uncharacterized protein YqgC (DUF456 family)
MLDVLICLLLLVIALAAIVLNVVSLPGNWVILAAGLGMCIYHNGHRPGWIALVAIFVVLLVAEVIELISGLMGARKFGASKAASWGAVGGAIIGGVVGIPPLTLPTLGLDHLFAAVAGAFLAAWIIELIRQRPMKQASLAALGAALGRAGGLTAKIGAGIVAWVILLLAWLVPLVLGW